MPQWNLIAEKIKSKTNQDLDVTSVKKIMGGDINESYYLKSKNGAQFFIKTNAKRLVSMFAAEAEGLAAIATSESIRVPEVIVYDQTETESFLVLEYLELCSTRDHEKFGRQLAAMHRCTKSNFGWHRSNTIGSTVQINSLNPDWCEFWINCRLRPQLAFAQSKACSHELLDLGEKLMQKSQDLFVGHKPQSSLLHGDLWGGNASTLADGTPVIFDPAVYFGDREADLAMMELFGGFSKECFSAYFEVLPIDQAGYVLRKQYYNLYHLLNHFNLFGGGYQQRCINDMQKILAEI